MRVHDPVRISRVLVGDAHHLLTGESAWISDMHQLRTI